MDLVLGSLAVLFVLLLAEVLPWHMSSQRELVLIAVESAAVAALLFGKFDRWVVAYALAIAGLAVALRALYRLVRACADEREVTALLRARGR